MWQGRLEWVSDVEGQMQMEKPRLINGGAEDKKGSEKMITVDCLRKRLVAERTASKAAKENADVVEEKLAELEKVLKMEIEAKERAEKKLKLAIAKLKSLKLASYLSQSNATEDRDTSSPPSTGMTELGITHKEEERGEVTDLSSSQDSEANNSETSHKDIFVNLVTSRDGSSSSVEHNHTDNAEGPSEDDTGKLKVGIISEDSPSDVPRLCSTGGDSDHGRGDETEEVHNPLALVPVPEPEQCLKPSQALVVQQGLPPSCQKCGDPTQRTRDIYEVLVALQRAKTHLQNSIERRAAIYNSRSFGLCGV
ncbi:uncharacterized protein [Aristolochia californica]|uniref:uncharacterized protein n=1 Tax=Aristolochia californica TaxID=171875 RepID=UPI0035E0E2F2